MKMTKRAFAGAALSAAGSSLAFLSLGAKAAAEERHHSRVREAIEALRVAHHELKEARHDYGGHRDEALRAIDAAIHQLELAEKFERHH